MFRARPTDADMKWEATGIINYSIFEIFLRLSVRNKIRLIQMSFINEDLIKLLKKISLLKEETA